MLDSDDQNDSGLGTAFAGSVSKRIRFAEDAARFYVCDSDGLWRQDEQALVVGLEFDNFIVDRVGQLDGLAGLPIRIAKITGTFCLSIETDPALGAPSSNRQAAFRFKQMNLTLGTILSPFATGS
jgi:hypothetical protein